MFKSEMVDVICLALHLASVRMYRRYGQGLYRVAPPNEIIRLANQIKVSQILFVVFLSLL